MSQKRVYDCFPFFNELDLLELRLREHDALVDYFVITEATLTFKGSRKPLFLNENISRFAAYRDKIRHLIVDDVPPVATASEREFHQRRALQRGLTDLRDDDVVIVSDCDEILKPSSLSLLRNSSGYFMFDMPMYQFFLNMLAVPAGWNKPFAYSWSLRESVPDYNRVRQIPAEVFAQFTGKNHLVTNAGWHFTFLGGAARVIEKIQAYAHAEHWQQRMLQPGAADSQMLMLKDVGGGQYLKYCDVDDSFPQAVRDHLPELIEKGLVKSAKSRIEELQPLLARYERDNDRLKAQCRYLGAEVERLHGAYQGESNLAIGKPSLQSSVSRWSRGKTPDTDARGGNDGLLTGVYGFHTALEDRPWWQVDLQDEFFIREIRIFNRPDQAARLRHFSIQGSLDGANWFPLHVKADDVVFGRERLEPYVISFDAPQLARHVRVQLEERGFLHFDECLVFGNPNRPDR